MMEYMENFPLPILGFEIGLCIGSLIGFCTAFFFLSSRRLHLVKIIFSVNLLEHILIWLTPVAIVVYLNYDSCAIITILKTIHFERIYLLGLWIIGVILLIGCYVKNTYEKNYDPEIYAELRAERAEYTIWTGTASLTMFVLKDPLYLRPEEPKSLVILSAFYLLLIISIYYRHLSQAIYMQEAQKPKQ